jgi:hypothetical protein
MPRKAYLFVLLIGSSALLAGITGFSINSIFQQTHEDVSSSHSSNELTDAPIAKDLVKISVHDKNGNLKSQQTVNNIVTGAGAIFFCTQQGRCLSEITAPAQVFVVLAPTYWVEFITGTANANEPQGSDCTAPSGGGALAGDLVNARCNTVFSAGGQYQVAGGSVDTLGTVTGQLRNAGATINGTNSVFTVQTTKPTICSIVTDVVGGSSTCQFSETTPVMTNQSGGALTVNGLALFSGTSTAVTGNLIIAEATITPVVLAAGDTISVTWTIIA